MEAFPPLLCTGPALVKPPVLPNSAHFLVKAAQPADKHVTPFVAAPVAVSGAVPADGAVPSVVDAFLIVASAPVFAATTSPAGLEWYLRWCLS